MSEELDRAFVEAVSQLGVAAPRRGIDEPVRDGSALTGRRALELFDAQLTSRHLDLAARRWRERGHGYYTIGSAGHEGNAAVAAALRPTDPALLHYRSGAFYAARAGQVPGLTDPVRDVLLGMLAAADEPIAGGRHKVFGHPKLAMIPQTSTIASHLPRAVGVAFTIGRAPKLDVSARWPTDAVAVCSFGDASINHSTAQGAFNAAGYIAAQGLPVPLLLVCEDNGWGISVPTPGGWAARVLASRPGIDYVHADGCDLASTYDAARSALRVVRRERRPVILHLSVVRYLAHAGTDVESAYRTAPDVQADVARDPLVATARLLVTAGVCTPADVLDRSRAVYDRVEAAMVEASSRRRLASAREVMAPLAPRRPAVVAAEAARVSPPPDRASWFPRGLPEHEGPLTLAQSINRALHDLAAARPELLLFGEDVGVKGGVYGVTRGLQKAFGPARVFDTLLDEQTILGVALGAGVSGLLPVPEIQYLAYLHNAEDQIRGEGATQQFFSCGAFRNPMVVRIASFAYQKGFGGHFHNDNAVGVLRDVPGLVVAAPALPDDAAAMLRTCAAAAVADGSVCVFLEPIALYHEKDRYDAGDGGWLAAYAPPSEWQGGQVAVGSARTHGAGGDLTLVSFANGLRMSLRVARRLADDGINCRVVDLRWLAPLPVDDLLREATATGRVLVVDETRRTGGVSEGVVTALLDAGFTGPIARVTSEDSFIPLGPAANLVLLDEPTIEAAARKLSTQ